MKDYWEDSAGSILTRLDEIMETVYFVPLALGDTLAVQFRIPALKGLSLDTVNAVFNLIGRLDIAPGAAGEPDPDAAAARFFSLLKEEQPQVFKKWTEADRRMVVDPLGAMNLALTRGERQIQFWLDQGPEKIDLNRLTEVRVQGLADIMNRFDPTAFPDDRRLRAHLKDVGLQPYPAWARPGLYLDIWTDFIRAVMDQDPRPETKARWPY